MAKAVNLVAHWASVPRLRVSDPTLVDSGHDKRQAWIDTLTEVQALAPEIVVAAHRREDAPDDGRVLADTISYLEEANRVLAEGPSAAQFVDHMLAAHPTRQNVTTVIYSALVLGLK